MLCDGIIDCTDGEDENEQYCQVGLLPELHFMIKLIFFRNYDRLKDCEPKWVVNTEVRDTDFYFIFLKNIYSTYLDS